MRSGDPEIALRIRCHIGLRCAAAPVIWLDRIGFWGGIDVTTGTIVDALHPRRGLCLEGAICLLGATKGSTAGPGALIEWVCGENPPAALLTHGSNLSVAVAAQALPLIGVTKTVLGELDGAIDAAGVAAWDGCVARLEAQRIVRCS